MCTCYRNILNNSNHFCCDCDKFLMRVPCGHCDECASALRKDWFVRCFYEYSNCPHNATFFYTLTYDNEHIPRIPWATYIPCFSKRDVQLFIKRLRVTLDKYQCKMKYMVTSEFGEKKGRPHYHVLFFLSRPLNPHFFYYCVKFNWKNGFVKSGENNGVVFNSLGISYVTKYVTKDFLYTDKFLLEIGSRVIHRYQNVIRLFSIVHGSISVSMDENGSIHYKSAKLVQLSSYASVLAKYIVTRITREIRRYLPFHIQSTKLGISILNEDIDFDSEIVSILQPSGKVSDFPLPRYIKRKLWYEAYENERDGKKNLFRLNDAGKLHYKSVIDKRISDTKLKLDSVIGNLSLLRDDAPLFISKICLLKFKIIEDIDNFVSSLVYSTEQLAIYDVVFRGRVCPISTVDLDFDCVLDSSLDYAERCIEHISKYDFGNLRECSPQLRGLLERHSWNNVDFIQPLERALQVLDAINLYIKTQVSDATIMQEKLSRRTRQLYKLI